MRKCSILIFNKVYVLFFCVLYFAAVVFLFSCHKEAAQHKPDPPPPPPPPELPNIVLILSDDVGYEVPTIDGGKSYATPFIDQMANAGMRFTQCHAAPTCSPSRFMLLTGKYSFRNYRLSGALDLDQRTIANMLHDAGYATCISGKWQLDGGDNSIKTFGFDAYSVFQAYLTETDFRYKNPLIYQAGNYLPDSVTLGKYGEDWYADYAMNFMDSVSKTKNPFFVYYAMANCHEPFSPTPDDAEFDAWVPKENKSDPKFFPSMANYMDKKVQAVVQKIKSLGIENKTLILFAGDNGTPNTIYSLFNDTLVQGGKSTTIEYGTHVPLIAYWPGHIAPGSVNNDLIDFTDFFPTIAEVAGVQKLTKYGILDGVSFAPRLQGQPGNPRQWIFLHYQQGGITTRYVQNTQYKFYEGTAKFYNIVNDIAEDHPLKDLDSTQSYYRRQFQQVLSLMH